MCRCLCLFGPDGSRRLRQRCQELPGGRTPYGHHLLKADGQQRAIGWETAAFRRQAVIGSDEITRPGRTFICRPGREERETETDTKSSGLVRNTAEVGSNFKRNSLHSNWYVAKLKVGSGNRKKTWFLLKSSNCAAKNWIKAFTTWHWWEDGHNDIKLRVQPNI